MKRFPCSGVRRAAGLGCAGCGAGCRAKRRKSTGPGRRTWQGMVSAERANSRKRIREWCTTELIDSNVPQYVFWVYRLLWGRRPAARVGSPPAVGSSGAFPSSDVVVHGVREALARRIISKALTRVWRELGRVLAGPRGECQPHQRQFALFAGRCFRQRLNSASNPTQSPPSSTGTG